MSWIIFDHAKGEIDRSRNRLSAKTLRRRTRRRIIIIIIIIIRRGEEEEEEEEKKKKKKKKCVNEYWNSVNLQI
jgi:hypothetical protein